MWSKEMMDLRQDADKNTVEATVATAKYIQCAARPDEQGHAHPDITELDTLTDLCKEGQLLVNMTDKLDDCRQAPSLATPTKHAVLTDLRNETTRLADSAVCPK